MSAGKSARLSAREIAELSLICALMVAGKEGLRVIPNVHPVTLLLLLATAVYGVKALYPAFGFAILEIALYGAGLWNLMYLYVWPIVVFAAQPRALGRPCGVARPLLRRAVRHPISFHRRMEDGVYLVAFGHPV